MVLGEHETVQLRPEMAMKPSGSGAVIALPSGVSQRSQRKSTTCGWNTSSWTTKLV